MSKMRGNELKNPIIFEIYQDMAGATSICFSKT
jgi:hypothetical protein